MKVPSKVYMKKDMIKSFIAQKQNFFPLKIIVYYSIRNIMHFNKIYENVNRIYENLEKWILKGNR